MQRKEHDGQIIEATARQNPDTNRWNVRVVISWEQGTDLQFQPLDGPEEGFEAQTEAESWGIAFGEKWLDDGKPDLQRT